MSKMSRANVVVAAIAGAVMFVSTAQAGTVFNLSGTNTGASTTVSGTLDVTLGTDSVTVVVTNTTPLTLNAAQLLTAFEIHIQGINSGATLTSALAGNSINVLNTGAVQNLGSADLKALNTWGLTGTIVGTFNPNAEYGIIGPAQSDGTYSQANGSIKVNPGHNPFVDRTATFVIGLAGVTPGSKITDVALLFGTDFGTRITTTVVPMPASVWMGVSLLGGIGAVRAVRRRKLSA